jgi:NAD(P)-dependent dehydrogenase (short-subunit alcohol dehydrogenase family)
MAKSTWDATNIPDQQDRVIIVTGSTSGIGKEAARVLAGKNAKVVMAVRNTEKGEKVAQEFREAHAGARVDVRKLDLTSLASVKAFADGFFRDYNRLDVLINNAGIMMSPYGTTKDGFELQMGTNHLGHFALAGHLLPLLKSTRDSRIVAVSSVAHTMGNIDFDDINWEVRKYATNKAYGDSKLANLHFVYELADRLKGEANVPKVTAAHPGWTKTELQRHSVFFSFLNNFFAQGVDMGALPTLRAATDPLAQSKDYFGPTRFFGMHGNPEKVGSNKLSKDTSKAKALWKLSEKMTAVHFE